MSGNQPLPEIGLEGYCPVHLVEKRQWQRGNAAYGTVHRGRTYLFTDSAAQQKFLADPDRFSPVIGGYDIVLAIDKSLHVPGRREHGAFYQDRMYLFATEETLRIFNSAPARYAQSGSFSDVRPPFQKTEATNGAEKADESDAPPNEESLDND